MSTHDVSGVSSGIFRECDVAPGLVGADHGVEGDHHLAHGGNEGFFVGTAFGDEALIEGLGGGVEADGAQGTHEQGRAYAAASAFEVALSAALATVVIEGSQASQGGDRLVGGGAELGHAHGRC